MSKTSRHFLVAVPSPTPALEEEGAPATFRRDDCVLLTDDIQVWIVRSENISLLEASRNFTLVHLFDRKLRIRRALATLRKIPAAQGEDDFQRDGFVREAAFFLGPP